MKFRFGIPFLFVMVFSPVLNAQDTIVPDRPGIGNGSFTVAPGDAYLESGIVFRNTDFADQFDVGQLGFRTGLTHHLELQILLNSISFLDTPANDSGVEDLGIGLKRDIVESSSFQLALLGILSIPTGSEIVTNNEWIPQFSLIGDYSISEMWTLSSNLGYSFGVADIDEQWLFTLTPSITPFSQANFNIYGGYAGLYDPDSNQHFAEFGLILFPLPYIQLDINSGFQFNSNNYFVGIGFSAQLF